MAFTYSDLIKRVRTRTIPIRNKYLGWGNDAVLFTLCNDVVREFSVKTKDYLASASLSIIAGQTDYTISSAIASDIDEIQLITIDTGNIEPREIRRFQYEIHAFSAKESEVTPSEPLYFTIVPGGTTLRLTPTPSTSETATVYYSVKASILSYSPTNLSSNVPLLDSYFDAVVYEVVATLFEAIGEEATSRIYFDKSRLKLEEAKAFQPEYDFGGQITFQDVTN